MAESPIIIARRWELTNEILGAGAYGKVYKGVDLETKEYVAIKFFDSTHATVDNLKEAKDETNLLKFISQFNIPGVVKLLAGPVATTSGWYAVYNLINGNELLDYLVHIKASDLKVDDQKIVSEGLYSMMVELCETVKSICDICIVHQDLKPQNIMKLKGKDRVTVIDFGLACVRSNCSFRTSEGRVKPSSTLPQCADFTAGTPGYNPPEHTYPRDLPRSERRIDVYALGRVLYDMGSGRLYLNGTERKRWRDFSAYDLKNELERHSTGIAELDALIAKMMMPQADLRLTINQAVQQIQDINLNGRPFAITKMGIRNRSMVNPELKAADDAFGVASKQPSRPPQREQPMANSELKAADDAFGDVGRNPSRPLQESVVTDYLPDSAELPSSEMRRALGINSQDSSNTDYLPDTP